MSPSLLTLAGLGLVLGFRHAFEPDHLAAVSTLATRQASLARACQLGVAWAIGHTASVGVVVLALIITNARLPAGLWPAADFVVAVLLVALGGSVVLRFAQQGWHLHAHPHGDGPHFHPHTHAHPRGDARRSLGFGLLHGLAGSAALLVLLVAAAPTRSAQFTYFIAFACGTMTGMVAISLSLGGIVRIAAEQGGRWATALHLGSAATSVAVGCVLAARVLGRF